MTPALSVLNATRINTIMNALQDTRSLPQDLVFLGRTPVVPALDGEITASYQGTIHIADLIADDSSAVAYNTGKFILESTSVPNLKTGVAMSQTMLNQLNALVSNLVSTDDRAMFTDWENRTIDNLLLSVRQRMEALIVAMHVGSLSYDRLGIKLSNVTWGRPSDLSITVGTDWSTANSATPVADLIGAKKLAAQKYGIMYDRVTMSSDAFDYMVATTEFQNKAKPYLSVGLTFTNLTTSSTEAMRSLAERVIGMAIELYDARHWSQSASGIFTSTRYMPVNKVILSSSANDNNPMAFDWANGIVTESIVGSLASTAMIGNLGGARRGPLAYATVPGDLNPPSVTYWGVARGFPRLHLKQASACLTVGSFADSVSSAEPVLS